MVPSRKYVQGVSKLYLALKILQIFQNNILLVCPLITYSVKMIFASLLAFLLLVYIKKHNIDKYRYEKIFDIPISNCCGQKFLDQPLNMSVAKYCLQQWCKWSSSVKTYCMLHSHSCRKQNFVLDKSRVDSKKKKNWLKVEKMFRKFCIKFEESL